MPVTIERVDTIALRVPYDHWAPKPTFGGIARETMDCLLVRITASNGLVGWGESFWGGWQATQAAIEHWIAPLATGQDVNDRTMFARFERALHNFGRSGPFIYALAGLDIALWDLRGKLEGVPLHALLGGKKRDRVESMLAACLWWQRRAREAQYGARTRTRLSPHQAAREDRRGGRGNARNHRPNIPIMVDTNCAWLPDAAYDAVMAMKPYDPLWVEEPVWPAEDIDALGKPAQGDRRAARRRRERDRRARIRAAGRGRDRLRAAERGEERADGAMGDCRKAEESGATCVPHSPYFGPAIWRRCMCSLRNRKRGRWSASSAISTTCRIEKARAIENGWVNIPDMPGLGPRRTKSCCATFASSEGVE